MNILKLIGQAVVQLAQTTWRLPPASFDAVKIRQQWMRAHQLETEPPRGICQPEKYCGK